MRFETKYEEIQFFNCFVNCTCSFITKFHSIFDLYQIGSNITKKNRIEIKLQFNLFVFHSKWNFQFFKSYSDTNRIFLQCLELFTFFIPRRNKSLKSKSSRAKERKKFLQHFFHECKSKETIKYTFRILCWSWVRKCI